MHFFNPVPAMRLVEVVAGPSTAPGAGRKRSPSGWARLASRRLAALRPPGEEVVPDPGGLRLWGEEIPARLPGLFVPNHHEQGNISRRCDGHASHTDRSSVNPSRRGEVFRPRACAQRESKRRPRRRAAATRGATSNAVATSASRNPA
jgi:hypothetical protein